MSSKYRNIIFNWTLGLVALGTVVVTQPDLASLNIIDWLLVISLIALIAAFQNLGVAVSFGKVTFMPTAILTAYLALTREQGFFVLGVGLLIGGGIGLAQTWLQHRNDPERSVSTMIGDTLMWDLGRNGLSLLAADWAFRETGGILPFIQVPTIMELERLSPILVAPVIYLLVYNFLLIVHLSLQGLSLKETLIENRRIILGIQVLPMVAVPFGALTLANLGITSFLLFESILLAMVIVIYRLTIAQNSLNTQVSQLRSFSAMNRALRTTLEVEGLLETTYHQVSSLLTVENLHIILRVEDDDQTQWQLAFAAESGKMVKRVLPKMLDGLLSKVLDEGVALLADPVIDKARKLKISNPPPVRAWMAVPMMTSMKVLGCLCVWLDEGEQTDRTLTENDLDMLLAIASQSSVAIDNAKLYAAAQQQASQLARLNQISTLMNASLNPGKVLELIANSLIEVAGCHRTAIYLFQENSDSKDLLLAHAEGFSNEYIIKTKESGVPLTEDEYKTVIEKSLTIAIPDIYAKDSKASPAALLIADTEEFAGYAYFPLRGQKKPIGMLAIYYNKPHHFSNGELELLETFANQAALSIANARIYQNVDVQLSRRVEQIVQMADINRRLSATLDLETIFDLIIDTAMEATEADASVLVLMRDIEDTKSGMDMVAWRGFDPARSTRAPHHVAEGLATKVLEGSEPIITSIDDPDDEHGPRSQLSVPIMVENRTIGALALESEMLDAFQTEDITFVSQLAMQASVAIHNAQIYRRAQSVRDRLHAILDASNDGLVMIDPKSRIVMTNTRMSDFWDFARSDFSQRTPDQFLADPLTALGEGLGYSEGELKTLMQEGFRNPNISPKTDLYEVEGQHRRRFVERTASAVHDEQSNFMGLLLIFKDVTEQKELEQAREDLANMIVHDLRAPLQAVMGGMSLIKSRADMEDKIISQATTVSTRAVKKLLNLVNNLLDLSRLEQDELQIDPAIQSVGVILEDVSKELMPLAQEVNAVFKVDAPATLPSVNADRDMVERVVLNLVDNALKYAPPGSLVHLGAIIDKDDDKMIRVQITDSGPGIPDDFKTSIFNRYSMVPGQKGRRRSAGLGLAFCKIAVEAHTGKIWVEDNPEGGTVVCFTLPISTAPPEADDEKIKVIAKKVDEKKK